MSRRQFAVCGTGRHPSLAVELSRSFEFFVRCAVLAGLRRIELNWLAGCCSGDLFVSGSAGVGWAGWRGSGRPSGLRHVIARGCGPGVAGAPGFAEVAAGNGGLLGDFEAVPVQEAGEPVRTGEDLAVDPGVARVLSEFGCCGE